MNYNAKKYRCDIPVSAQTKFTKTGTEINIASDMTSKKHYCKIQLNASSRIMLTQLFYSICHFVFVDEKIQDNTHERKFGNILKKLQF